MNDSLNRCTLFLIVFPLLLSPGLRAQSAGAASQPPKTPPGQAAKYYDPVTIAAVLRAPSAALGDRLRKPGNERITTTGTFTDKSGTSNAQVVIENGGKFHFLLTGAQGPALVFDSVNASGKNARLDQDGVLESFVDDSPDGLILAAARGIGIRMLGQRFKRPGGGQCDLYDVPLRNPTDAKFSYKRYCFDSTNFLLQYVQYSDGSTRVETQFDQWQVVKGQAVPRVVTRIENGVQVFRFQAAATTVGASSNDGLFGK